MIIWASFKFLWLELPEIIQGASRDDMVGGVCKVIFMSNPTVVLRLGWGFDNSVLMWPKTSAKAQAEQFYFWTSSV